MNEVNLVPRDTKTRGRMAWERQAATLQYHHVNLTQNWIPPPPPHTHTHTHAHIIIIHFLKDSNLPRSFLVISQHFCNSNQLNNRNKGEIITTFPLKIGQMHKNHIQVVFLLLPQM